MKKEIIYLNDDFSNAIDITYDTSLTYYIKELDDINLTIKICENSKLDLKIIGMIDAPIQINVDMHHAKDSSVDFNLKVVTLGRGCVTANINSIAKRRATNVSINQQSKILPLGAVKSTINPNLILANKDVEAEHGVSIGNTNESLIYYLNSKGMETDLASKLLVKGFLLDGASKASYEFLGMEELYES